MFASVDMQFVSQDYALVRLENPHETRQQRQEFLLEWWERVLLPYQVAVTSVVQTCTHTAMSHTLLLSHPTKNLLKRTIRNRFLCGNYHTGKTHNLFCVWYHYILIWLESDVCKFYCNVLNFCETLDPLLIYFISMWWSQKGSSQKKKLQLKF